MNSNQKLLLVSGTALAIISAIYIASASVPSNAASAMLFPFSILGVLFGIAFVIWSIAWIVLEKTRILK